MALPIGSPRSAHAAPARKDRRRRVPAHRNAKTNVAVNAVRNEEEGLRGKPGGEFRRIRPLSPVPDAATADYDERGLRGKVVMAIRGNQ